MFNMCRKRTPQLHLGIYQIYELLRNITISNTMKINNAAKTTKRGERKTYCSPEEKEKKKKKTMGRMIIKFYSS